MDRLHTHWFPDWEVNVGVRHLGQWDRSVLVGIHQDGHEKGGFSSAVDPGMVGTALDHHIEGFERVLGLVQYQGDFSGQEDDVVG